MSIDEVLDMVLWTINGTPREEQYAIRCALGETPLGVGEDEVRAAIAVGLLTHRLVYMPPSYSGGARFLTTPTTERALRR